MSAKTCRQIWIIGAPTAYLALAMYMTLVLGFMGMAFAISINSPKWVIAGTPFILDGISFAAFYKVATIIERERSPS